MTESDTHKLIEAAFTYKDRLGTKMRDTLPNVLSHGVHQLLRLTSCLDKYKFSTVSLLDPLQRTAKLQRYAPPVPRHETLSSAK